MLDGFMATALDERIRDRLHDRKWYRAQGRFLQWKDRERENDTALLELLRTRSMAKRMLAIIEKQVDDNPHRRHAEMNEDCDDCIVEYGSRQWQQWGRAY